MSAPQIISYGASARSRSRLSRDSNGNWIRPASHQSPALPLQVSSQPVNPAPSPSAQLLHQLSTMATAGSPSDAQQPDASQPNTSDSTPSAAQTINSAAASSQQAGGNQISSPTPRTGHDQDIIDRAADVLEYIRRSRDAGPGLPGTTHSSPPRFGAAFWASVWASVWANVKTFGIYMSPHGLPILILRLIRWIILSLLRLIAFVSGWVTVVLLIWLLGVLSACYAYSFLSGCSWWKNWLTGGTCGEHILMRYLLKTNAGAGFSQAVVHTILQTRATEDRESWEAILSVWRHWWGATELRQLS